MPTVNTRVPVSTPVKTLDKLRSLPIDVTTANLAGTDRTFTRHTNRNGDPGGFVESTAYAGPNTYVGVKALVLDSARMEDHSMIYGKKMTICGDACMMDYARVYGGNTTIRGHVVASAETHLAENLTVSGHLVFTGHSHAYGEGGKLKLFGDAVIGGDVWMHGNFFFDFVEKYANSCLTGNL